MELPAIDQILAAWDERLGRVDENLLALEADATYQTLSGLAGRRARLEGTTRDRVSPALDALLELFEQRAKLTAVLDRARAVRASVSKVTFWQNDEKIAEVLALLRGPSIQLGAKLVPLAQRNLLDVAAREVAVSPEDLLTAMVAAYEVARDAVTAVARAWATLEPAIERAARELTALRRAAEALGPDVARDELAAVERELTEQHTRIAVDPLGVAGNVDGVLRPRIEAARARLTALTSARTRVDAALAHAAEHRRVLDATHVAARRAATQGPREFEEGAALPAPLDDALLPGLDPWLEKLRATAAAGRWQSAEVGLARWQETAEAYLATDRAVVAAYDALAGTRTELLGRLSARRAQLAAFATRGVAIAPDLEATAREAETLLGRRPAALARAIELVDRHDAAVARLSRR